MTGTELLETVTCGEDSRRQFKRNATNADALQLNWLSYPAAPTGTPSRRTALS